MRPGVFHTGLTALPKPEPSPKKPWRFEVGGGNFHRPLQRFAIAVRKKKAPKTQGLRRLFNVEKLSCLGVLRTFMKASGIFNYIKPNFGGNGGIRTLDEALHPILP